MLALRRAAENDAVEAVVAKGQKNVLFPSCLPRKYGKMEAHAEGIKAIMISTRTRIAVVTLLAVIACDAPFAEAGSFRFVDIGSFPAGTKPAGIAVVDLNHDGRLDVLAANDNVPTVSVMLGQGVLEFSPPVAYPTAPGGRHFHHSHPLVIGDFNRDRHVD
ncbi:MAG: VCBS repeat-containing protein [Dokdonella sp.]